MATCYKHFENILETQIYLLLVKSSISRVKSYQDTSSYTHPFLDFLLGTCQHYAAKGPGDSFTCLVGQREPVKASQDGGQISKSICWLQLFVANGQTWAPKSLHLELLLLKWFTCPEKGVSCHEHSFFTSVNMCVAGRAARAGIHDTVTEGGEQPWTTQFDTYKQTTGRRSASVTHLGTLIFPAAYKNSEVQFLAD